MNLFTQQSETGRIIETDVWENKLGVAWHRGCGALNLFSDGKALCLDWGASFLGCVRFSNLMDVYTEKGEFYSCNICYM